MPVLKERYEVTTIGITDMDMLKANFVSDVPELPERYDVVLHAAGKAHVYPKTEAERQAFYDVNYKGTIHLCDALEKVGVPKAMVFISTMNVYGSEPGKNDTEERALVGDSPYSDSKIKAEQYLTEWCKKHNVVLGILRPGLLAGEDAPGNLGAMVKGIKTGAYLSIAGGKAKHSRKEEHPDGFGHCKTCSAGSREGRYIQRVRFASPIVWRVGEIHCQAVG